MELHTENFHKEREAAGVPVRQVNSCCLLHLHTCTSEDFKYFKLENLKLEPFRLLAETRTSCKAGHVAPNFFVFKPDLWNKYNIA